LLLPGQDRVSNSGEALRKLRAAQTSQRPCEEDSSKTDLLFASNDAVSSEPDPREVARYLVCDLIDRRWGRNQVRQTKQDVQTWSHGADRRRGHRACWLIKYWWCCPARDSSRGACV